MTAAPALIRADTSGTIPKHAARAMAELSDGTVVALVSNNSTNNLYLYHSPDRITWTLKTTIAVENANLFSMCVEDTGDHLQIVYGGAAIATPTALKWIRLVKSAGPTFTASTVETIISDATLTIQSCDIDPIGAAACVVAYRGIDTTPNPDQEFLRVRSRGTGGSWGTVATLRSVAPTGSNTARSTDPCTISTDVAGVSGGVFGFAVGASFWGQQDCAFYHGTVTVATGALGGSFVAVSSTFNSIFVLQGPSSGGMYANAFTDQRIQLFRASAGVWRLITGMRYSSGAYYNLFPYTLTWSGSAWSLVSELGKFAQDTAYDYARPAVVLLGTRLACMLRSTTVSSGWRVIVYDFATGKWSSLAYFSTGAQNTWECALGGSQRFVGTTATFAFFDEGTQDWYSDYNQAVGAPNTVTPADTSTVNTDVPTLSEKHGLSGNVSIPTVGYWQIADNSGFSTNLKTVVEPIDEAIASSTTATSETVPVASQLTQGLKYFRAATMDVLGKLSSFVATQTFTVSHPPNGIPTDPSSGHSVDFGGAGQVTFDWDFSDTSTVDFQTAFQVIVERNSDGLGILDSGKVTSGVTNWLGTISATYKDVLLRWKVRVWDSDDVQGPDSSYVTFMAQDAPTVAVTAPTAAQVLDNPAPTFTWSFAASGGRTQAQARVIVFDVTGSTFQAYDSGVLLGAGTSHTPSGPVLVTGHSYRVEVTATDSVGLSKLATQNFSVVLVLPATPVATTDVSGYDSLGYALVSWTNGQKDANFVAYRVYRKLHADTAWTLLYETRVDQANYTYHDWMAGSGYQYDWAVVQVANRYGVEVESAYSAIGPYTPKSTDYWLIDPDDETLNTRIAIVKDDSFHLEIEKSDMKLIDRGIKSDYGTTWGHRGSLSAEVWDTSEYTARTFRLRMETLQKLKRELWMRNPFGDLWLITMADAEIGRIQGVGLREFHTMALPYVEVT